MGLELTTLTIADAYPTVLSRHVLKVSDFLILIKSCSIESRDPSPKSEVVHETKFSLKISYLTLAKMSEMSDLCYYENLVLLQIRDEFRQ